MRDAMKTYVLVPAVLFCLLMCGPAVADEALLGTWELTLIGEVEPDDGQSVTYVFGAETVVVTMSSAGATLSWELGYSVSEGALTFDSPPGVGPGVGEPGPLVLTYKIEGDALVMKRDDEGFGLTLTRGAGE